MIQVKATSIATQHKLNNPSLIKVWINKLGISLIGFPSYNRHMHAINVKVNNLWLIWDKKNMIKDHLPSSKCYCCSASSNPRSCWPSNCETSMHHTSTYKHASATNKKQYTKQCKQYKTRLQSYSTRCKDRVSARIVENGVKTGKLWLKQDSRAYL